MPKIKTAISQDTLSCVGRQAILASQPLASTQPATQPHFRPRHAALSRRLARFTALFFHFRFDCRRLTFDTAAAATPPHLRRARVFFGHESSAVDDRYSLITLAIR